MIIMTKNILQYSKQTCTQMDFGNAALWRNMGLKMNKLEGDLITWVFWFIYSLQYLIDTIEKDQNSISQNKILQNLTTK